jgi:acetyl-CoA synthetase
VKEAISGLEIVQKVVVYRRIQPVIELGAAHAVDFYELIAKQPPNCPVEVMDSQDPLFVLYTSGTTGKPKGVVHVHGGYMVGTYYQMTRFWDIRDDDVFFCTSDIGGSSGIRTSSTRHWWRERRRCSAKGQSIIRTRRLYGSWWRSTGRR